MARAPTIGTRPRVQRCRRKFLRFFPGGFYGEKYRAWERDYKEAAHASWRGALARRAFLKLLDREEWLEIAATAARIEGRTNLLFSFEKMALRDAVRSPEGARPFAESLFDLLHGHGPLGVRFDDFARTLAALPRRQTRVLTWPVQTVFPFIAQPEKHIFVKPNVTRRAAEAYGFELAYESRPSFQTYANVLDFARVVQEDLSDLEPRDMIDIQSFIWVLGSDEYLE
jgi:hypothetical protein